MNICVISGEIQKQAVVRGKKTKALAFIVTTTHPANNGNGDTEADARISHVPCVIFSPSEDLEHLLTNEGAGKFVELQGRINGSRFEGPNGQERYNADIVVFKNTFRILNASAPQV